MEHEVIGWVKISVDQKIKCDTLNIIYIYIYMYVYIMYRLPQCGCWYTGFTQPRAEGLRNSGKSRTN